MARIRVLVADGHALFRAGLRLLLNTQPDMEVIGEAGDSRQVLSKVRELAPDVLTLELSMPGGGSIQAIEQIRQNYPRTHVLVLTVFDDPAYLGAVLAAGGSGYVVKTATETELFTALRAVCRGRTYIDAPFGHRGAKHGHGAAATHLSQREREVLVLLAQGHGNRDIAHRLFLSVKTVETYRARITNKLELRTRAELVRYALETGLLGPTSADRSGITN
jgi:DNA-binding NarL/FixJ family response regulator